MSRVVGVDVARCLALVGMVAAHLLSSEPVGGRVDIWFQVVAGRSSALFAVLAGLSIALITRQAPGAGEVRTDRLRLLLRAALIAGWGLLLGAFGSGVAVILTYYGVLFLLAVPVLRWRAGPLALLAVGWGAASPLVSMLVRDHLPETTQQVPNPLSLANPWQLLTELTFTGYYPVVTWATYLFAGMAIGRLDLRSPIWGRRLLIWGGWLSVAALAVASQVTRSAGVRADLLASYDGRESVTDWASVDLVLREGLHGTHPTGSWWWLGVWSPHSGSIVDLAHTTGAATAVIGLCLVLVGLSVPALRRTWQVACGAGTMTLTLYSLHVVVLALPAGLPLTRSLAAHVAGILLLGATFVALRSRGPLETLVSQLTSEIHQPTGPCPGSRSATGS